ncbi:excalibur calcium-binding domain-containing protein [Streptomyces cyaneofuscatus]|uniref:excalibur calcium-binding domain-containing protein n=1 Tax=Streptomyces cyaneofuscatus TaxID=66883 RepID=UPI003F4CD951
MTVTAPPPEPAAEAPDPVYDEDENDDSGGGSTYYRNCTAVRAAGADPIRAGEPGYGRLRIGAHRPSPRSRERVSPPPPLYVLYIFDRA